jgi:23S rRNA (cytosine1962-C5)-methyltransferase
MGYPKIILKPGKEQPVQRFHPWIFSGAISAVSENLKDGDIAEVFSSKGRYLATGHFQDSSIAVKIFTFGQQEIDRNFWYSRLAAAFELRKQLNLVANPDTNCYRLVHNEGDSLPGLIIDIYDRTAVIQAHSTGMYMLRETIADALVQLYGNQLTGVYNKSAESLYKNTGIKTENSWLLGSDSDCVALENSCRFAIDIEGGQKTGFFLDQRENRSKAGYYSKNRKVLNMFSYTGGFSVYALKSDAEFVHSVDSSAPACKLAEKNVSLNEIDSNRHKAIATDARQYLENMQAGMFDMIILDPPAFAKNTASRHNAIKGYSALNTAALKKIARNGILFTFSCSQVVSREQFTAAVTAAAIESGRRIQVLEQLGQSGDHPVNIFQPESEYLKGLILRVE